MGNPDAHFSADAIDPPSDPLQDDEQGRWNNIIIIAGATDDSNDAIVNGYIYTWRWIPSVGSAYYATCIITS